MADSLSRYKLKQLILYVASRTAEAEPELCFVEDPANLIGLDDTEQARASAAIERYLARAVERRTDCHPERSEGSGRGSL